MSALYNFQPGKTSRIFHQVHSTANLPTSISELRPYDYVGAPIRIDSGDLDSFRRLTAVCMLRVGQPHSRALQVY